MGGRKTAHSSGASAEWVAFAHDITGLIHRFRKLVSSNRGGGLAVVVSRRDEAAIRCQSSVLDSRFQILVHRGQPAGIDGLRRCLTKHSAPDCLVREVRVETSRLVSFVSHSFSPLVEWLVLNSPRLGLGRPDIPEIHGGGFGGNPWPAPVPPRSHVRLLESCC